MSCGLTPDFVRMLEQMALQKEQHARETKEELERTTQQVEVARKKLQQYEQQTPARIAASPPFSATTPTSASAAGNADSDASKQPETPEILEPDILDDNGSASASATSYDWTRSYEKWDAWQDVEELVEKEQEARAKSERAARMQHGCNHDHSAEQKLMDMSTKDKLVQCEEFRALGNLFFHEGQFQRAAFQYHQALIYFEYIFPDTEDEEAQYRQLKLAVHNNFAACRLRTGHLDDVLQHCQEALDLDAYNLKALLRRAQSYRLRDDFDRASQDIETALQVLGQSDVKKSEEQQNQKLQRQQHAAFVQEKALLLAKKESYRRRLRQVSSAMFNPNAKPPQHQQLQQQLIGSEWNLQNQWQQQWKQQQVKDWVDPLESWRPNCHGLQQLQEVFSADPSWDEELMSVLDARKNDFN